MDIETQTQLSQFSDFHNKAFIAPFIFGGSRFGRDAFPIEGSHSNLRGHCLVSLTRQFLNEQRKASAMIMWTKLPPIGGPSDPKSAPVQPI